MVRLEIIPHGPVIARDGRPFGSGQSRRMRCLEWIYPSMLAGSFRTSIGKMISGGSFDADTVNKLKSIEIRGPFLEHQNEPYFAAPRDIVLDQDNKVFVKRPVELGEGEGCDLPASGLLPTMLFPEPDESFKPKAAPIFWSLKNIGAWLTEPSGESFTMPETFSPDSGFVETIEHETRTHIKVDHKLGAVNPDEGMLFMTDGLCIPHDMKITALVSCPTESNRIQEILDKMDMLHPLGGERRLGCWQTSSASIYKCPGNIKEIFKNGPKFVRMILATPAIFSNGWYPGWLNEDLIGSPPETSIEVKLVGVCVDRWKPVSGWSLEKGKVGPKPIRRLVPAGSVYFFEMLKGNTSEFEGRWLQSVSDMEQDRRDGFGLALWGIWAKD